MVVAGIHSVASSWDDWDDWDGWDGSIGKEFRVWAEKGPSAAMTMFALATFQYRSMMTA